MAQSACEPGWNIPTLEDTFALLMDHSDRTVQFLHRQMAQGHRLQDPRTKACTLWNAMSRTAHLFDCLWRSEPDPDRFENLRERVFVVHTDAKTKLKALELFVKLQQTRRQRPHESQQSQSKPCHPALPTPITQESVTYDASITDTIGRPTGQAVPDLRGTNVANASRELDMACGMSPKPDKHVKQNHTVQIIGQNRWLPTNRDPNLARRTRHHNETQYPTSRTGNHTELESYLTNDCYYVGQFPLHPEPRIDATIFGAQHDSYRVQTFKKLEDAINQGARRYSFPPPTHIQAPPHYNKPRTPLALEYTSFHTNQHNQPLHKEPWTGPNSRWRTKITNVNTRQHCLRSIEVTDEKVNNHQIVETRNEHRKRKTAGTKESNMLQVIVGIFVLLNLLVQWVPQQLFLDSPPPPSQKQIFIFFNKIS